MKKASEGTKNALENVSNATSIAVQWVISFAPFGIMGLIFTTISEQGLGALVDYAKLIVLLVGAMAVVAFVVNPIIAFICIRKNPYPLVLTCLKESFITAFFTRSSAANIPVNMELCKSSSLMKTPIPFLFRSVPPLTWPRSHHHFYNGSRCCHHSRHRSFFRHSAHHVCARSSQRSRCVWRRWRIPAFDPTRLQSL